MSKNKNGGTLLEKALAVQLQTKGPRHNSIIDPDSAIACLKGEVRCSQLQRVLWPDKEPNCTVTQLNAFLIRSLRQAYAEGKIIIKP